MRSHTVIVIPCSSSASGASCIRLPSSSATNSNSCRRCRVPGTGCGHWSAGPAPEQSVRHHWRPHRHSAQRRHDTRRPGGWWRPIRSRRGPPHGPRAGREASPSAPMTRAFRGLRPGAPGSHAPVGPRPALPARVRSPRRLGPVVVPPPRGRTDQQHAQASRAQKLPPRCFLRRSPRRILAMPPRLFLRPVGSGLDGRDPRADDPLPRARWLAGGPGIPRGTRQSMCREGPADRAAGSAAARPPQDASGRPGRAEPGRVSLGVRPVS